MICNIEDPGDKKNFHVSKFKDNLKLEAGTQDKRVGRQNPLQEQGLQDAALRIITSITDGRAQHTLVFWHISVTAYHLVAPVSFSTQRLKSWEAEHIFPSIFCLFHAVPLALGSLRSPPRQAGISGKMRRTFKPREIREPITHLQAEAKIPKPFLQALYHQEPISMLIVCRMRKNI